MKREEVGPANREGQSDAGRAPTACAKVLGQKREACLMIKRKLKGLTLRNDWERGPQVIWMREQGQRARLGPGEKLGSTSQGHGEVIGTLRARSGRIF